MRSGCVYASYAGRVNLRSTAATSIICSSMAVLAMNPGKVDALNLGPIDIRSAVGQPLRAVVPVIVDKGEVLSNACIATSTERTGLVAPDNIVIDSPAVSGPGEYQIQITTPNPLHEPMYEVSLVVDCPRIPLLVRHYVVMLDLPDTLNPVSAVETDAPAQTATVPALRPALPDDAPSKPLAPRPTANRLREFRGDEKTIAAGRQYRVRKGDTLSTIAARVTGRPPDTIWRVADEIFKNNPKAFVRNDANLIMLGALINIPDAAYLASIGEAVPLPESDLARLMGNDERSRTAELPDADLATSAPIAPAEFSAPDEIPSAPAAVTDPATAELPDADLATSAPIAPAEFSASDEIPSAPVAVTDPATEAPEARSPVAIAEEPSETATAESLFSEVVVAAPIISQPADTGSFASEPLFSNVEVPDPIISGPLATRPMASDPASSGRVAARTVVAEPTPSNPVALRPKATDQAETGRQVASTDVTVPVFSAAPNSEPVAPENTDAPPVAARPDAADLVDSRSVMDAAPVAARPVAADAITSDPIISWPGESASILGDVVVNEPIIAAPNVSAPEFAEPSEIDAVPSESAVAEPPTADTLFSDAEISEPIISSPVASRPVAADPIIADQTTADPVAARPAAAGRSATGPITAGTEAPEPVSAVPVSSATTPTEPVAVVDAGPSEPADPGPVVVEATVAEPVFAEPAASAPDISANQESTAPDISLPVGSVDGVNADNQQFAGATENAVVEDPAKISPFADDFPPEIPTDVEIVAEATENVVARTTSNEISPFVAISMGILLGLALSLLILRGRLLKPLKALFGGRDPNQAFVHERFQTATRTPFRRRKSKSTMDTHAHAEALFAEDNEFLESAADAAFGDGDTDRDEMQFTPTTQPFEETYIVEIIPNTEPTQHEGSVLNEPVDSADSNAVAPVESDDLNGLELSDTSTLAYLFDDPDEDANDADANALAYLFDDPDESGTQNVIDPTVKIPAQDHSQGIDPTAHMPTPEPPDNIDGTVEMPAKHSDVFDPTVHMPAPEPSGRADPTVEMPTRQQPSDVFDPTVHMPTPETPNNVDRTVEMPTELSDVFDPTVHIPTGDTSNIVDPTADVDMEAFGVDETMMAQAFTEELEALDLQDPFNATDETNEDDDNLLDESANFDPLTGLDDDELPEGFDEDEPFSETLGEALSLLEKDYEDEFTASQIIERSEIQKTLDLHGKKSDEESDEDNTLNRSRGSR